MFHFQVGLLHQNRKQKKSDEKATRLSWGSSIKNQKKTKKAKKRALFLQKVRKSGVLFEVSPNFVVETGLRSDFLKSVSCPKEVLRKTETLKMPMPCLWQLIHGVIASG